MKSETGGISAAGNTLQPHRRTPHDGPCTRRGRALLASALLLALPGVSLAAIVEFNAGMTASGTAPFSAGTCVDNSTNYTPGEDICSSDNVVRTHDTVYYDVGFSLTPQDDGALLVLEVPPATYPGTYTGGGTPRVGYFHVEDIPTGTNGCRNIQAAPLTEPVAPGVSGVTADGKKLYCAQPTPISANSLNFGMRIDGAAPNGTIQPAPTFTFSSDNNPTRNNPTPLTGHHGGVDLYGLNPVVISAAPRWDAVKSTQRIAAFVAGSGPGGEDGFIFSWNIGIRAVGSIKGLEALETAGWTENYSDLSNVSPDPGTNDFPNARLVTWPISNAFANTNITGASSANGNPRNCGDWYNLYRVLGNYFDNRYYYPNDRGNISLSSLNHGVARGGECVMVPGTNNTGAKTAQFELIGTDYSLNHYPTRRGNSPAAGVLVDPLNPDSASNEYWVASKTILVWAPITDIVLPPGSSGPVDEFLTNRIQFNGTSVTGQANVEPPPIEPGITDNNAAAQRARRTQGGSFSKIYSVWPYNNPNDWDVIDQSDNQNQPGDSHVNQMSPHQYFSARLVVDNPSTSALGAGYFCDKLDNTRLSFVDMTGAEFSAASNFSGYTKDPATGLLYRYSSGLQSHMPVTFQLGVGGNGITDAPSAGGTATTGSGTWTTMTIANSEYTGPGLLPVNTVTGDMATATCGDADARWFNSVTDLLAAGYTVQDVSRVRGSMPFSNPGVALRVNIPLRVRDTTQWATSVSQPGLAYDVGNAIDLPAGSLTMDDSNPASHFTSNQAMWVWQRAPGNNVTQLGSDTARIFQTEYVQISKSSPTHVDNASVTPGSRVTYNLLVNLSTTGSVHTTDVQVYDVLPAYLSYVPGSTTFGGAPFGDPTCVTGPAPWPTGWGEPTVASVAIPADFKACRWVLPNQTVTKAARGHASANLPVISFQTRIAADAPNNTLLLNTAYADSDDNLFRDARYAGADAGYACSPSQACSFSDWRVRVNFTAGAIVSKAVERQFYSVDTPFDFILEYGAIGSPVNDFRIVDVFPYNGDGRVPATNFQGTLGLAGPLSGTATGVDGTADDTNVVVLYTNNAPGNINTDPFHLGHWLDGTGTNTASTTNWCASVGGANCPADWSDVTAILVRAKAGTAPVNPGEMFNLRMPMAPQGNAIGDVYTNGYTADSPDLLARRPGSNYVWVRVTAPDLVIAKSVTPTSGVVQNDNVEYTVVVRNSAGNPANPQVGPFEAGTITVTDSLPTGLTLQLPVTATGWDCGNSTATQLICNYTGTYPIPVNAAVGGPITFEAKVTSLNNQPVASFTNTARVSTPTTEVDDSNNTDDATFNASATPMVGAYKQVHSAPAAQGDGSYLVTFQAGVRNYGPQEVSNVSLTDLLSGSAPAFGTHVSGVPAAVGTYTVPAAPVCTLFAGTPVVGATYAGNPAFNGDSNTNLLAAGAVLPASTAGQLTEIRCEFQVRFVPRAGQTDFQNTVTATGTAAGTPVSDVSQNGSDPVIGDPTLPPTNSANNTPTPISVQAATAPGIDKTVDPVTYNQGAATNVQYTLVVRNTGADGANGFTVVDNAPAGVTFGAWTCTVTTGGTAYVGVTTACGAASGNGNLNTTVDMRPGAVITYTINATVAAGATGTLTNTATVTAPAASCTVNCTVRDTADLNPHVNRVQPTIVKSGNLANYIPGTGGNNIVYTITVGNNGPDGANGFVVTDTPPPGVTIGSWTCALDAAGDAFPGVTTGCGTANGTGALNTTANLAPNGRVIYTVNATIAPTATGALTNTASVAPPSSGAICTGVCPVTDTHVVNPSAGAVQPTIAKSVDTANYTPGTAANVVYTIVVGNTGTVGANDFRVVDAPPAGVTIGNWTCAVTMVGNAYLGVTTACDAATGSGNLSTTVDLQPGAVITFTVNATVEVTAGGVLINTAEVDAPAGTVCVTNCHAEDTATINPNSRNVQPTVSKSATRSSYEPGTAANVTYTIVVGNTGTSGARGFTVVDTPPAGITINNWSCTVTTAGTASDVTTACAAATGTGVLNTTVDLQPGAVVTFTIDATIAATATGDLTNTVAVNAPPSAVCAGGCAPTDTHTVHEILVQPTVTKNVSQPTYMTGTTTNVVYTIVVGNTGPDGANGFTVVDTPPTGVTIGAWTCAVTTAGDTYAGVTTGCAAANGTGTLNTSVNLQPNAVITFTVNATVEATATGNLVNTVEVNAPRGSVCSSNCQVSDTSTISPADRNVNPSVTKTANIADYVPGVATNVVYTIVVSNAGPDGGNGFTVTDTPPAGLTIGAWTCAVTTSGTTYTGVTTACGAASGSGALSTTADLQPGGTVTYTVNATIAASATGNLINTATVGIPPNAACASGAVCPATDTSTVPEDSSPRDLQPRINKTVNISQYDPGTATPVIYTIVVRNEGAEGANGFTVVDTPPAGVTIGAWTCAVTTAGTAYTGVTTACGAAAGSGVLNTTVDLQPGAVVTYTVNATIDAGATGSLVNRAEVRAPSGTVCVANCVDNSAAAVGPAGQPPHLIPANNPLALLGLMVLMMLGAGVGLRQYRR